MHEALSSNPSTKKKKVLGQRYLHLEKKKRIKLGQFPAIDKNKLQLKDLNIKHQFKKY
jgi:hypothetical protein